MYRNVVVAAALAGSALAQTVGNAVVINSCPYPLYLQNTPAANGGYEPILKTLNTGETYTQQWTQLSNNDGWSMKLSVIPNEWESGIMQYEYTWLGWDATWGGTIWFDLSDVNGNPWNGNWEVTGTDGCEPRQAAYMYSTDDAYGMQSCDGSASVTVNLCASDSQSNGSGSGSSNSSSTTSAVSSPAAASSTAVSSARGQPTPSPVAQGQAGAVKEGSHKNKATPTTLMTMTSATITNRGGVTVTEVATEVITSFVTATAEAVAVPDKRHAHAAHHAHHNF